MYFRTLITGCIILGTCVLLLFAGGRAKDSIDRKAAYSVLQYLFNGDWNIEKTVVIEQAAVDSKRDIFAGFLFRMSNSARAKLRSTLAAKAADPIYKYSENDGVGAFPSHRMRRPNWWKPEVLSDAKTIQISAGRGFGYLIVLYEKSELVYVAMWRY